MRIIKFILIFLSIIFISGCLNLGSNGKNQIEYSSIEFELLNIPNSIEKNQVFNPILRITNLGKYTIPSEGIYVKIIDKNQFKNNFNELEDDYQKIAVKEYLTNKNPIRGKFLEEEFGDLFEFDFKEVTFNSFLNSGQTAIFNIEQCHKYETQILSEICISKDSYGQNCNSAENKKVELGSDDIRIYNFEQINSIASGPNVLSTFKIEGQYIGSSNIKFNDDMNCLETKSNNKIMINKIQIGSKIIDNIPKYCGSNILNLDNKNNFSLICKGMPTYDAWTKSSIDFTEKITISINYLKTDIISKDLIIL